MTTVSGSTESLGQESKRQLELIQLETRYKSTYQFIKEDGNEAVVRLAIKPTDPDFPFELNSLKIQLFIPSDYPSTPCKIQVLNTDIPKGFAINLEKGYEAQVTNTNVHYTLVRQMNWLDRNMENLLQQAPAPTVRFISHKDHAAAATKPQRHVDDTTRPLSELVKPVAQSVVQSKPVAQPSKQDIGQAAEPSKQREEPIDRPLKLSKQQEESFESAKSVEQERYTTKEKLVASKQRKEQLKQLQTRFCDSFKTIRSSQDETIVSIVLDINDTEFKHEKLLNGKQINLRYHIPLLYPLEPCTIEIENRKLDETRKSWVQEGFNGHPRANSLFENLNWMNRHLQLWMSKPLVKTVEELETDKIAAEQQREEKRSTLSVSAPSFVPKRALFEQEVKKNRVIMVNDPRLIVDEECTEDSSGDSSEDSSEDSEGSNEEASGEAMHVAQPRVKRGTDIRLVNPTLENVSLFRSSVLHVAVKCARCKDTTVIENIKPEQEDQAASHSKSKTERWIACPTCSSIIGVKFFAELVHQGMKSLGLLQLAGCSVYEILPSSYIGTCGQCMTDMSSSLQLSTHDAPHTVGCFSCHAKMTFALGEYRFVKIGEGDKLTADESQVMKLKKKKKRGDALVIGEPLSDQGTCSHYRKSKRWFRFPCCHKLYACDICHDSHEDHSYDLARRHVCGLCSREQSIVIGKPCPCGNEFEKAVHKGAFWEGGKGVRNKDVMSRKDPHKHKGIGKTVSRKQDRVGTAGKENVQDKNKK